MLIATFGDILDQGTFYSVFAMMVHPLRQYSRGRHRWQFLRIAINDKICFGTTMWWWMLGEFQITTTVYFWGTHLYILTTLYTYLYHSPPFPFLIYSTFSLSPHTYIHAQTHAHAPLSLSHTHTHTHTDAVCISKSTALRVQIIARSIANNSTPKPLMKTISEYMYRYTHKIVDC